MKKMYLTGLFTQVAESVKSNYLLIGTAKDRLSVTMEVMTTRLTEPENAFRKLFVYILLIVVCLYVTLMLRNAIKIYLCCANQPIIPKVQTLPYYLKLTRPPTGSNPGDTQPQKSGTLCQTQ